MIKSVFGFLQGKNEIGDEETVKKDNQKRGLEFYALGDVDTPKNTRQTLNILLLADNRHEANVVQDHINAFGKHSRHNVFVVNPIWQSLERCCQIEKIDVILIHYSILTLSDYFLPEYNAEIIRKFSGPKAQIIQDECRWINRMKDRMVDLGIGAVFSSLGVGNMQKVYGGTPLRNARFYSCLPGYIPVYMKEIETLPISERPLDIVYRGRELAYWYGKHAREKSEIANHMLRLCGHYGGLIDISAKESTRIYGDDWLKFVASGRTTLGVEGGVSIFDFDGTVEKGTNEYLEDHSGASFKEVFRKVLKPYEGNIIHKTITPRIFESICLKTALILYPGNYNGLLKENIHYIPLSPNGENDKEVAKKLKDHAYLQELVDRTFIDIVDREELQASYYVEKVEDALMLLTE